MGSEYTKGRIDRDDSVRSAAAPVRLRMGLTGTGEKYRLHPTASRYNDRAPMLELLSDRRRQILKHLVEAYVDTAMPVSSEAIARRSPTGVSSATVRNELATLEELGLVRHPHTSAGRMPTEQGYR